MNENNDIKMPSEKTTNVKTIKLKKIKKHKKNKKKSEDKKEDLPAFEYWTDVNCVICCDQMREKFTESPLNINEHMNLNIFILPCGHQYHASCFLQWYKKQTQCPYCRRDLDIKDFKPLTLPRLRCRATILKSKDVNKIGQQCECLEYPNNMGFCKKHLPPLFEITSKDPTIELGNRKLLTLLKYEKLKAFPAEIQKELLNNARIQLVETQREFKNITELLESIQNQSIQSHSI